MRAPLLSLVACALLALGSFAGCGGDEPTAKTPTPAQARAALAGAPAPLAALHRQANELLSGGRDAFDRRMETLKGRPVVVTKWASWCGPCASEFPLFQRASVRFGRRIAFLGLNVQDSTDAARSWMDERWAAFPTYEDHKEEIARAIGAPRLVPITVFFDSRGRASVHQGEYRDDADLRADIERYALGS